MNVFTRSGAEGNADFAHQAELVVPAEVVSMYYVPHTQEVTQVMPHILINHNMKNVSK